MEKIELILFIEEIKSFGEMVVLKILGYENDVIDITMIESYSLENINDEIGRLIIADNQKQEFIFDIIIEGIIIEEDSDVFIIPIHNENTCLQIEKF